MDIPGAPPKPVKLKSVTVQAFFPELKGNPNRVGHGKASNWTAATSRALKDIQKQIKGKRIHSAQLTISITDTEEQ